MHNYATGFKCMLTIKNILYKLRNNVTVSIQKFKTLNSYTCMYVLKFVKESY